MDKYFEELKNLEQQVKTNLDCLLNLHKLICDCILPRDADLKKELEVKQEFYLQEQVKIDYRIDEIQKILFLKNE